MKSRGSFRARLIRAETMIANVRRELPAGEYPRAFRDLLAIERALGVFLTSVRHVGAVPVIREGV